ncbi:MAG: formate dehydrogenase accessory sulfurtransferase FdhD [Euryarchaeota archaeon]|nr:formate dehydrogenase accessory sulfurtransferase FdhD [Euryarchaeota archaeon]
MIAPTVKEDGLLKGEQKRAIHKWDGEIKVSQDNVAIEKSLQLFIQQGNKRHLIGSLIATPINLRELAIGLLASENILKLDSSQLGQLKVELDAHQIIVHIDAAIDFDMRMTEMAISSTPSCGWCGRTSIEEVIALLDGKIIPSNCIIEIAKLLEFTTTMARTQIIFNNTGGVHAAAIFSQAGELISLMEDVGRHNAVDKAIGDTIINGKKMGEVLVLSGRAGMELIHKAAIAKVEIVISVGAPTTASIDLARHAGISLLGFARDEGVNIYTHPNRLI